MKLVEYASEMSASSKTSPFGSLKGASLGNGTENSDYLLHSFLASIQLESFEPALRDKLQITRVAHFDYVKPKDLEKIGMSKPAVRRLLDAVARSKKLQFPARTAPQAPSQTLAKSAQAVLARANRPVSAILDDFSNISKVKTVY